MSNVVEKIKEKVDQVLHKNDNTNVASSNEYNTTTGNTVGGPHHHNQHHHHQQQQHHHDGLTGTTGAGMTGSSGLTGTSAGGMANPAPNTQGPHRSDMLNRADPRVDSDADGRTNMGVATHGPGGARSAASGPAPTTAGPHSSDMMNKIDPRVDSDADGSRNAGMAQYGVGAGNNQGIGQTSRSTGYGNTTEYNEPGMGGYSGTTGIGSTGAGGAGPHNSAMMNKLDPRVDSDMDGSRNAGMNQGGIGGMSHGYTRDQSGITGTTTTSGGAGPHSSSLLNKLDPRVDSDRDGSRNAGIAQTGPGGAMNPNTSAGGMGGGSAY